MRGKWKMSKRFEQQTITILPMFLVCKIHCSKFEVLCGTYGTWYTRQHNINNKNRGYYTLVRIFYLITSYIQKSHPCWCCRRSISARNSIVIFCKRGFRRGFCCIGHINRILSWVDSGINDASGNTSYD